MDRSGAVILLALAINSAGTLDALAVAIYCIALMSTLLLWAIYNLWPVSPAKWLLRRFHLWQRLRFQNAIWHIFVLLAMACHVAAVTNLALT